MSARAPSTHVSAAAGPPGLTVWGETTTTAVAAAQTGGAFALASVQLPPGWRRPTYVHHWFDECFVVQSGRVRFCIEDRPEAVVAGAGDTVYVPRGLARSAELVDDEPATVLLLQTPAPPEQVARQRPTSTPADVGWLEGVELIDAP